MINLPKYIKIEIFNKLKLSDLLNIRLVNKLLSEFIKNNKWTNIMIKYKNDDIKNIISTFNFDKFYCNADITDESVKMLGNCHTLNLSYCKNITDESVKMLGNCHTLDLSSCYQITDKSVKILGNCHTLDLYGCTKITDESVKMLGNCHTLNLSHTKITDESVKMLGNCHKLYLSNTNITYSCINKLRKNNVLIYR